MSATFTEHFDGTNGTTVTISNTAYTQGASFATATCAFDTSTSAAGTASAKIVQTASSGTVSLKTPIWSATNVYFKRWCLRLNALPSGNTYVSAMLSGGTTAGRVAINSAGKVFLQDGTTTVATGTVALSAGTWYRFEWDLNGTTSTVRVYAGPSSTTLVDTISATVAGTTFTQGQDGLVASSNSTNLTLWWDEVGYDTAATPGPLSVAGASSDGMTFDGTAAWAASSTDTTNITGSAAPVAVAGSAGAFALTGSAAAAGAGAATGGMTITGSAGGQGRAASTGSVALSGSSAARGVATASGAVSITGTAVGRAVAASTGGLSFTGTSTVLTSSPSTGNVAFAGAAVARAVASSSGGLSLDGGASATVPAQASGSLSFTGISAPHYRPSGQLDLPGRVTMRENAGRVTTVEGFA
jgi:hypothetical protein